MNTITTELVGTIASHMHNDRLVLVQHRSFGEHDIILLARSDAGWAEVGFVGRFDTGTTETLIGQLVLAGNVPTRGLHHDLDLESFVRSSVAPVEWKGTAWPDVERDYLVFVDSRRN